MKKYNSLKKILNLLAMVLMVIMTVSCSDYLNRKPLSDYDGSGIYANEEAIKQGVTGCYQYLYQDLEDQTMIPLMILWDIYTPFGIERAENNSIGVNNIDMTTNYTAEFLWATLYSSVTRCNLVISGAEPHIDGLSMTAKQYYAEAKILRAYYYWELISLFGGDIPFFTAPVTDEESKGVTPTSWQDIVDFLLSDIDGTLDYLPWRYTSDGDWGRIDKTVALGLKARLALYAGSWDKFGYGYKGVTDETKAAAYFDIAAQASKAIMDQGVRSLCPNFDDLFTRVGQMTSAAQNENMFQMMFSDQGVKKTQYLSAGECVRMFGQSGRFPTQMLVDQYECSNGKRIDDPTSGYNPANPFTNRDPRLKYTIYTQHDTIIGNTGGQTMKFLMEIYNPQTKMFNDDGTWVMVDNKDYTGAVAQYGYVQNGVGFAWRKYNYFDDEDVFTPSYNIILMRYAEILLTYAEAKIELNQLDASVYDAIDQVRARQSVHMPSILSVDPSRAGDQVKMRQIVRRERKVELVKESLYFFDMRRWRLGALQNSEPTYGYPLATGVDAKNGIYPDGYTQATPDMVPYFGTPGSDRDLNDVPSYAAFASKLRMRDSSRPNNWNDKYYIWPIPATELKKAPWLARDDNYR